MNKKPQDDIAIEITRLTNENQRLRAALVATEFNIHGDFEATIRELKKALSGDVYDADMQYIAGFNHDKINLDDIG